MVLCVLLEMLGVIAAAIASVSSLPPPIVRALNVFLSLTMGLCP